VPNESNITLTVDATLLREIQELAAAEGTSVSALVAARLEQIVREPKTYDRARKRALARLRERLDLRWTRPRSRDQLHKRCEDFVDTNVKQFPLESVRRAIRWPRRTGTNLSNLC
jgi:hypothetical protein